jgi:hypothetical protein
MSISIYFPPLASGGSLPTGLTAYAGSTTLVSEPLPDGTTGTVLQLNGSNPIVGTKSADGRGGMSPWSGAFVLDALTGGFQLLILGIRADTPRNNDVGFVFSFNSSAGYGLAYFRDNSGSTTLATQFSTIPAWTVGHWYLWNLVPVSATRFQIYLFDASAGQWLNASGNFVTSSTPVACGDHTDASAITGAGISFAQIEAGISFLELASTDGSTASATAYTLTPPALDSGPVGSPSGAFTLQPTGGVALGRVSIASTMGGTVLPTFAAWAGTASARHYTVTESASGTDRLVTTNSMRLSDPSAAPYTAIYPAKVAQAQVGVSGQMLWLLLSDQSGNPSNVSAVTTTPTITVNGVSGSITLGSPIWGVTQSNGPYLPYVVYPLSAAVSPGAAVVVSFVDRWAKVAAGYVGAGTVIATNYAGQPTTLPFTASAKTTRVGVNIEEPGYAAPVMPFADLGRQIADWNQGGVTVNSHGNVTSLGNNSFITALLVAPPNDPDDSSNCYPSYPTSGTTTLQWTGGTSSAFFLSETSGGAAVPSSSSTAGGVTTITYSVTPGPGKRSPGLQLGCQAAGANNVHIYPPGVATDGSQIFHPKFLAMVAQMKCLRSMVALGTNNSAVVDYGDFAQTANQSFIQQTPHMFGGTITRFDPYTSDSYFGTAGSNLAILMTTSAPHGIKEGQFITLGNFNGGGPHGNGTFDLTNSGTVTPGGQIGLAHVLSPTTFAITFAAVTGSAPYTLATSYTSGLGTDARVYGNTQVGWPPELFVALCNAVGADCWINVPHAATDACATTLFEMIAANLNPGLKVYVEYTNEHWNNGAAFLQDSYCVRQGAVYNVGSGAALGAATLDSNGNVVSIPVASSGNGYQYARRFTCTGGTLASGGSAAYGYVTVSGGAVTGVQIFGKGPYTSPPTGAVIGGLSGDEWYVLRANQLHNLAATALTAAGRGSDLVRVIGVQFGNPGGASLSCAQYAIAAGIPVDRITGAPYFWSGPVEASLANIINGLNVDQEMDLGEWYIKWGADIALFVDQNMAYWSGAYPNLRFSCYEGGPDYGGLTGGDEAARSRRWARHPRMRWIMLELLGQLNERNTDVFVDFTVYGEPASTNGVDNAAMWPVYVAWNQQIGLGDGSDGLFDNRTNYEALDKIVSVVGGALNFWSGLIPLPVVKKQGPLRLPPRRPRALRRG